ncbi:MAG: WYL domain-containing protein [Fusobacteriaceae bacterium]|jgi:predicted DNA-binding transcriptional regulator YafY|nr:WYL domain-containing protein [Fusobacteriaceae bacterium]
MKKQRILDIYLKFLENKEVTIKDISEEYDVSPRSIQRDIRDLRTFFQLAAIPADIIYEPSIKGYVMRDDNRNQLTNDEILAVCKILLESRAFVKEEMMRIIDKIVNLCVPRANYKVIGKMLDNEKYHYNEPHHRKKFLGKLWNIGNAIQQQLKIRITYTKTNNESVKRVLHPVGLMFSEFYFYLLAFIENADKSKFRNPDDLFPTIYRVDRIKSLKVTKENFPVVYIKDRFEEGLFRKRVQFMTGGKLRKIRFKYFGRSLEAVLDRLPTAVVKAQYKSYALIEAEVFGDGIEAWIRGQGKDVEVIG